ncbi:armadillo repeat-containing protein 6-like [Amphiura filiformis]|uniref:armadillo repeat-containing protein 6-like n=1 Tax=Amphiura filiformis TaxID=82378 RepID=UPI003B20EE6E
MASANKRITQDTFDDVVKENMEEFDMAPEEALQEAIQQFESQGVNLSNIIKTLQIGDGDGVIVHAVLKALEELQSMLNEPEDMVNKEKLVSNLQTFQTECDTDMARRSLAATNKAFQTLYSLTQRYKGDLVLLVKVLDSLCSLCNGQPDLIDEGGMLVLFEIVKENTTNEAVLLSTIKAIRLTCVMHEKNRQTYVKQGLIPLMLTVIKDNKERPLVVREACSTLRGLTVDDDIRVPFGKAHDHAKMIVEEGALKIILETMPVYTGDTVTIGELCSTLGKLAVRNEFCQEIVDLGGLKMVLQILTENVKSQVIVKQVLGMLKAIAGNDNVKVAIVNAGGIVYILEAVNKHIKHPSICEAGCGAIAAITLRQPANCNAVMEANGALVIVTAMQIHKNVDGLQKQACMALRNLVARSREYCDVILELGAESLIRDARKTCDDEAKAALRDLGCEVDLKCLWKGENHQLAR